MRIKEIKIANYKSIDEITVPLGDFNVIAGANSCGKSNFVQSLAFIKQIVNKGLGRAVSAQGGPRQVPNVHIGPFKPMKFGMRIKASKEKFLFEDNDEYREYFSFDEMDYSFSIDFEAGGDFNVIQEQIKYKLDVGIDYKVNPDFGEMERRKADSFSAGIIVFRNRDGKIENKVIPHDEGREVEYTIQRIIKELFSASSIIGTRLSSKKLMVEKPYLFLLPSMYKLLVYSIYDFNPGALQPEHGMSNKKELQEDGANLGEILFNLFKDQNSRSLLCSLVKGVLPFVDDLEVAQPSQGKFQVKVLERYNKDLFLPSNSLSEGILETIAIIVAVFFNNQPVVIIESPERGLHPSRLPQMMTILKDAPKDKQIIFTTRNPEVAMNTPLEDLLIFTRNDDGYTCLRKPMDDRERDFLIGG